MTMTARMHRTARIVSVVAATIVALACGTNYAYSAWAPQFGDRLRLSSTQVNLVGTFGNFGTYSCGIPLGILVDTRGARPVIIIAFFTLGIGYFSLYQSYKAGLHAASLPWQCFFSFLSGVGGCSAFLAAIKTAAVNWPSNRGTATAFPLAGYGLSALFCTMLSHIAFPDDTAGLLLFFTIATSSMVVIAGIFLRAVPPLHEYSALPSQTELHDSNSSTRTKRSRGTEDGYESWEPGTLSGNDHVKDAVPSDQPEAQGLENDETSSLLSKTSTSVLGDAARQEADAKEQKENDSRKIDVRGLPLLSKVKFYQIWVMLGLLTGIGLMTINNIGSDARALWQHYDDSVDREFIQDRQLLYVEIISFASFCGRLISGVGSDIIVQKFGMSRYWLLLASSSVFLVSQTCAASISLPHGLGLVSALNGLSYGMLYGVSPTLVVEAFGIKGLSQNWGIMTLAPILFGNIFNMIYGAIYDSHSVILPNGVRDCQDGLDCYRSAYLVTIAGSVLGIAISSWSIRHDYVRKTKTRREIEGRRDA